MAIINQQNLQIKNGNSWYKLCPFPVGYIYMSTNSTSPATTYGGTWSALTDSKFLRPSGSWNSTGGSNIITTNNMPSHKHAMSVNYSFTGWSGNSPLAFMTFDGTDKYSGVVKGGWSNISTANSSHPQPISNVGGGQTYWQPYRTCYCWYRTA